MQSLANCGFVNSGFKVLAVFQLYSFFPDAIFTVIYPQFQIYVHTKKPSLQRQEIHIC
jgi:hypothetical protein